MELDWLQGLVRARGPERLPVVLMQDGVRRLLNELSGTLWLMASLMYGAGLRLLECVELRVKDVDLATREIRVRDGKGRKDRVTMIPARLIEPLAARVADIRTIQELLGHRHVSTTMIYTHVLKKGGRGVRSPFDDLP